MITLQNTSFSEAKTSFQEFLVKQNLSSDILWLFREDIIPQADGILVKTPLASENENLAERCYETGRKRGLGVCLFAFALLDSRPCCYVQLPSNEADAEYMMMSETDVKYSMKSSLLKAQPVMSFLSWTAHKLNNGIFSSNEISIQNMPYKKNCFAAS